MLKNPQNQSEIILDAELFTLSKYSFKSKSADKTYYSIRRLDVACVFPITSDNKLILIKQYRPQYGKTVIEEVAGHIEKNEDPLDGAKRELKEETGITARKWEKFGELQLAGSIIYAPLHLYTAKDLEFGKQNLDADEKIKIHKISLDEAVEKVISGEIFIVGAVSGILMLKSINNL